MSTGKPHPEVAAAHRWVFSWQAGCGSQADIVSAARECLLFDPARKFQTDILMRTVSTTSNRIERQLPFISPAAFKALVITAPISMRGG
jgi:hypothetical protein